MRAVKLSPVALLLGALVVAALSYVSPVSALEYPAQNGCVSETHWCSSGSCSRPIPDGGQPGLADGGGPTVMPDAGISLGLLKGYTVSVCGTAARPLAGAGTLKVYHCKLGSCAEVVGNAQSVTLTGTTATPCQEFPSFVIPNYFPSSERMVWASSGVTITNWDAGTADNVTVTVCPAQ
jgi:hypothetical protein